MDFIKRRPGMRRALCGLLALVLLWSALPAFPALAEVTHGVVTGDRVLFRKSTSGDDYWDRLDRGWIAKVLDETTAGGHTWFKVETNVPVALSRTYTGYIRGDFFRMLTQEEETAWLVSMPQPYPPLTGITTPPVQTTPAPAVTATQAPAATATQAPTASPAPVLTGDYGLVTVAGANLRQEPGGVSITALQKDQLVKVLAFPTSGNPWFKVEVSGQVGYLQNDHLRLLSPEELAAYQATAVPPAQVTPGATATLIPGPDSPTGTLRITKTSTNLRKEPGGTSLFQYPIGQVLNYYGAPVFSGGYFWARVIDDRRGLEGYIRSDCYEIIGGAEATSTPVPTAPPTPGPSTSTVRITLGGTNLRQTPGGTVIGVLARNRLLPFYGNPTAQGGYNWVYVYDDISGLFGYVRSDCYEFVTGAPTPVVTASPSPAPNATQPPAPAGTLTLIKGGVNLRNAPGGLTIAQLERGTVMNYFSYALQGGYTWYQVQSPVGPGWVRSDVVQLGTPGTGPTAPPTAVPTSDVALGYIVTIKSEINLREKAEAGAEVLGRVDRGQVYALMAPVVTNGGYNWYKVNVNGLVGYIRGDCARQMNNTEVANYITHGVIPPLTQQAPDEPAQPTGYVMTTTTSVNVRASASVDARTLGQIADTGTVFPLLSTVNAGGRLWYKIAYQGQEGYVLGTYMRMMTQQEYLAYIASLPTPAPTPAPTPVPPLSEMSSVAITTMEKVIIRSGPGSSYNNLFMIYRRGTVVELRGDQTDVGNETWYSVRASGINGWIRGDLLRILTVSEAQALQSTGDPDAPPTATYRTLQLGSTGEDVLRLNRELNRRGLLESAYVTETYTSQTAEAVRAFQRANGLVVDGIAGSDTQHAIYGTVPEDTYTPDGGGTVTPTIYPMELVDWYTGDINAFWGRGETAIMTDVRTNISLRIRRWAGGYHVDGEPLTSADTAALCRIYGVRNAQQIQEQNLYQRRPVWITLKGRSFAASLYGVPHNYPDGDAIPNNDFNGQLCVHFYNSRIHSSGAVDADHMRAIQYAYDHAPSRK